MKNLWTRKFISVPRKWELSANVYLVISYFVNFSYIFITYFHRIFGYCRIQNNIFVLAIPIFNILGAFLCHKLSFKLDLYT